MSYAPSVFDECALGDFEPETLRLQSGFMKHFVEFINQSAMRYLLARDVDAHVTVFIHRKMLLPTAHLAASLSEHPAAQRADKAGFFGKRYELSRRNRASSIVLPARQGFESCQLAAFQRHDRLVMKVDLFSFD